MGQYADMYREFARNNRYYAKEVIGKAEEEARRCSEKADYFDVLARRFEEAENLLDSTPSDVLKAARALYEQSPETTTRSDDSYSSWQDTKRWHELSPLQKVKYIELVRNDLH